MKAQLPHELTNNERLLLPSYNLQRLGGNTIQGITTPPSSPVRASAEWEEIDAIMIAWTSQTTILRQIIAAAQNETKVYVICSDSNTVISNLNSNSVPLTNIIFLEDPFNSIWCRDYGQWNVYSNDVDSLFLIDWIYNRPRPLDDAVPSVIANVTGLPLYQTTTAPYDLVHTGGNFMTDGLGTGFSSELILSDNTLAAGFNVNHTEAEIDSIMYLFMGINRYIKMPELPYDVIHHIDMHIKLLDEETLLVGEYPQGVADGPQIEANIQYVLSNFNSVFGTPYKVIRIPMPPDAAGDYPDNNGDYRTYANATFINKTVILPTYALQYDTTALRIWRDALPGYNVVGINCNNIIGSLGALHCITKEVSSSDPLLIVHQAYHDTYDTSNSYQIDARIQHRSGIANAQVFFRTDTLQSYQSVAMILTNAATNTWTGFIPAQPAGSKVYYYIDATANNGKHLVRPMPAPAGYWKFNVLLNTSVSSNEKQEEGFVKIFPNPASAIACIQFSGKPNAHVLVNIYDALGKHCQTIYDENMHSSQQNFFVNASKYSEGIYTIVAEIEGRKYFEKIVVR